MILHQRGTLRKLVRLWKRSALSFILAGMFSLFFCCCCSKKLLYGIVVLQCDKHLLCISRYSQASHYSSKAACVSVFLFRWFFFVGFFSSFLWSDAFYQSNRLAAVFEWPGPHTHTSQNCTDSTKKKCTDNQRERNGRGGVGTHGSGSPTRYVGQGRAEPEPFGKK